MRFPSGNSPTENGLWNIIDLKPLTRIPPNHYFPVPVSLYSRVNNDSRKKPAAKIQGIINNNTGFLKTGIIF
jgi:hypothetical protein